ncbi:hypothetical protein [Spirosoma sp. 209]|uniref:hypothetical protein n=1 Tax=Spirosoma sp. 209 TaxID=1955701 RepID=UPI0011168A27|nr:hypothetical protein [Spirosoma sp. 209]
MTTTTPTLSAAQLGRHIGQTVQVDAPGTPEHEQRGTLAAVLFLPGDASLATVGFGPRLLYRDYPLSAIRPVLRLVTDVTDAEWRGVFGADAKFIRSAEQVAIRYYAAIDVQVATINNDGDIWLDNNHGESAHLKAADLIDYLDSLGIDSRGLIQKGLAVRAENG